MKYSRLTSSNTIQNAEEYSYFLVCENNRDCWKFFLISLLQNTLQLSVGSCDKKITLENMKSTEVFLGQPEDIYYTHRNILCGTCRKMSVRGSSNKSHK